MKTPQNQKRLTNVAIVRYKKSGQRFEVACYPNTVEAWREGIETKVDEVLQSRQVFVNVSKGELVKWEQVTRAFATDDEKTILEEILAKGELQVGEKEREAALTKMRKEVATLLANMSVNPTTMRPYPVTLIEKVMKDVHFKPDPKKPAKKQAKELLEMLARDGQLPIQRAKMRLKIVLRSLAEEAALRQAVQWSEESRIESEGGSVEVVVLIKPGMYRQVEEAAKINNGTVMVVNLAVTTTAGTKEQNEKQEEEETPVAQIEQKMKQTKISEEKIIPEKNKRAQKEEERLKGLSGAIEEDDDWKNESKKKGGKKGGKKKK